jgi:AcrR family transcriptional regulator
MSSPELSPGRPYGGKSPQERTASRHQRLLEAGVNLFGTDGYGATSIEVLCRLSRVTPRYFYESFSSREELLREIYDQIATDTLEQVASVVRSASDEDVDTLIFKGVGTLFHCMLDDPRIARIFCIEAVGVSPALELRRRQVLHQFAAIISSQATVKVDNPELGAGTYDLVALAVVGGIYELVVDSISGLIDTEIEPLVDEVTAFVRDALTGVSIRRIGEPAFPR